MFVKKRRCLSCGYVGEMKSWLSNYNFPQFTGCLLLIFFVVPGLIFIAWAWGKYKCPRCGTVGKNTPVDALAVQQAAEASAWADPADRLAGLERLSQLKQQGVLTEEEFEREKRKLLAE